MPRSNISRLSFKIRLSLIILVGNVVEVNIKEFLPPKFPKRFTELCVMKTGVLVTKSPPGRLSPYHEGVHRSLHMCVTFYRSAT